MVHSTQSRSESYHILLNFSAPIKCRSILTFYLIDTGPIEHDSFSFERNHIRSNIVEHPKFEVVLVNGAQIVGGAIGNTSSLNGL